MEFRLLFVVAFCGVFAGVACLKWLTRYACNPGTGDYSIFNPNSTHYHDGKILNNDSCGLTFTADFKLFNIISCIRNTINVVLFHGSSSGLMGGAGAITHVVSCNKATYGALVEVTAETTIVGLSVDAGFSEEFIDSNPQVQAILRSTEGAEGYTMFAIGYPLTLELVGPAGYSIKPVLCIAYDGVNKANKTFIKDGCSLDKSLVFDFKQNFTSWHEEGIIPEEIPEGVILAAEMANPEGEEEEEEVL